MKVLVSAVTALAVAAPIAPVLAMPAPTAPSLVQRLPVQNVQYDPYAYPHRHYPRYGGYVGAHGGYKINRYGYGNYVGGPGGGFAGYPPGSAGAQIYRQKEEWKCQNVPETC